MHFQLTKRSSAVSSTFSGKRRMVASMVTSESSVVQSNENVASKSCVSEKATRMNEDCDVLNEGRRHEKKDSSRQKMTSASSLPRARS
jgi:hypothetical protein